MPLRGPEDEDGPDPDSPGRTPERGADAGATEGRVPAGESSAEDSGRAAPGPSTATSAGPGEAAPQQRTAEEKELEAEAMLAGLEQDPVSRVTRLRVG